MVARGKSKSLGLAIGGREARSYTGSGFTVSNRRYTYQERKARGYGSPGLACPECGSLINSVIDSRANLAHDKLRRRRECENGHRFRTYETIDSDGGMRGFDPGL